MFETVIQAYYNKNQIINFNNNYLPNPPLVGTSVDETVDFTTLYNVVTNESIGTIQFNNINKKILGNPNSYIVVESISIQLNNNTSLFASNYYKSDSDFYPSGTKYIISITSATGDFLNKTDVIIASIDNELAEKLKHLKSKPSGFPTIRYIGKKGSKIEDYEHSNIPDKDRSAASFEKWIDSTTNIKSSISKITENQERIKKS
jgi:hypothetical protein